jgi:NAD+ synthetase
MVELTAGKLSANTSYNSPISPNEEIYRAMVMGVKSYVQENNFSKVILGLSGGIDSAMVAAIAVDALGHANVSAIMLPSKFTSKESITDAEAIANRLRISLKTIVINDAVESLAKTINGKSSTDESSIMYQNLQARIRGTILMAESNNTGALLLTTGNKSEYATGYTTIYGDMNGAFNPIKDVYKTELYELARYKNVIPQHILNKAPSAELAFNQKDSDSLPEYSILDKILEQHIEHNYSKKELSKQFQPELVEKVLKLVKNSEFKRRQAAPGVKISTKNFEKDRRFPITNHYS